MADFSELRDQIREIEDAGFDATAVSHAVRILQLLRRERLRPTRLDPVDGEAVTFLFVTNRAQGSIDCCYTGEIVFAHSDANSPDAPKMWAFDSFDPAAFRDALDYIRSRADGELG